MGIGVGDYNHTGRPFPVRQQFRKRESRFLPQRWRLEFHRGVVSIGPCHASLALGEMGNRVCGPRQRRLAGSDHCRRPRISASGYDSVRSGLSPTKDAGHESWATETFAMRAIEAGPAHRRKAVSRGLAVGDLFNDGNMDVVIDDLDGRPMVLQESGHSGAPLGEL